MDLSEVLNLDMPLYAHRLGDEKESLKAHSELCLSYFQTLLKEKQLDTILYELWKCYFSEFDGRLQECCLQMLHYMVLFHDTGKINPSFQKEKMKNEAEKRGRYSFFSNTDHSLLSAVIYLDFCIKLIKKGGYAKQEQRMLKGLAYINAYVISRHHSDLSDVKDFADAFVQGGLAEEIVIGLSTTEDPAYKGLVSLSEETVGACCDYLERAMKDSSRKQQIGIFAYTRMAYSLLVASDYYATTQYMTGMPIKDFGDFRQIDELEEAFEASPITKKVRDYQRNAYGKTCDFTTADEINVLRNELFLDVETAWKTNRNSYLFFLEAPTGSGKSNVAMNLSFQMLDGQIRKIFYVYPFNTLVEQNLDSLNNAFAEKKHVLEKVAVVNSVTPIKKTADEGENTQWYYQAALLDRQFLNYPFVLTTHVSLFQTMFGTKRADVFGFMQLANSVVVLDEIQSYKNTIWSEIILFLKAFGELLNIKIIIMSATLPDLAYLTDEAEDVVRLVEDRDKYFYNPLFKDRVKLSYDLLKETVSLEMLYQHICKQVDRPKKILIEFIKKKTAYAFYKLLQESEEPDFYTYLITGDDNQAERKKILRQVSQASDQPVILVATQVIEAGVDIDMDIGYKDISKLDSEEQFLGRISRSRAGKGITFFFDLDSADKIYGVDIRKSPEFTLKAEEMRKILQEKEFAKYYSPILKRLKEDWNNSAGEKGLEAFFEESVRELEFSQIEKRMQLIEDNEWKVSVFFNREIHLEDGTILRGSDCWNRYKALLQDTKMPYAEKQIKLSEVRSDMSYFIYEVSRAVDFTYDDSIGKAIGQLLYIEDGEQYFHNGKLDMEVFSG